MAETTRSGRPRAGRAVTLKDVARRAGVSQATVSYVVNRSPAMASISPATRERVEAAARELDYRPNYMARSLRNRRSYSVGVLVPEITEPYTAEVIRGIENRLLESGYHYLLVSHRRGTAGNMDAYAELLEQRGVEGMLLVATELEAPPALPAVVVSGHTRHPGVTSVVIDHDSAARQALSHLVDLGHERIAFLKGQPGSSDTEDRWRAIEEMADELGIAIDPELTLQLAGPAQSDGSTENAYLEGFHYGRRLLATGRRFTALFAFDDTCAIGAVRAFLDAGLSVPGDISVIGFDDIQSAAFQNPSLTTVRQPLNEMGDTAAGILLNELADGDAEPPEWIVLEPELVVRGSTGPAPDPAGKRD